MCAAKTVAAKTAKTAKPVKPAKAAKPAKPVKAEKAVKKVSRGEADVFLSPAVAMPAPSHPIGVKGHSHLDPRVLNARDSNPLDAVGHNSVSPPQAHADRIIPIEAIREHYHQFKDLQGAETRLTLQIKALCRRACADDSGIAGEADEEKKKAKKDKQADAIYAEVCKSLKEGEELSPMSAEATTVAQVAIPLLSARASIHRASLKPKGEAEELCKSELAHIVEFVESVKGFSWGGVSMIVGEAGDLSNYANPAKLWKRLGLAPFSKNGVNKCGKTWRQEGGLTAEDWTAFGYSPRRRSVMFQITDSMMKHQLRKDKDDDGNKLETTSATGYYGEVYLARRKYLTERYEAEGLTVLPGNKINDKNRESSVSIMKIHSQSLHYTQKRLLLKLWKAWNGLEWKEVAP